MSLFQKIKQKLFGNPAPEETKTAPEEISQVASVPEEKKIRVFDSYGQELLVTRTQWWKDILKENLDKNLDDPAKLYDLLLQAFQDDFTKEILPYVELLARTDTRPSRGRTLLGFLYMDLKRFEEAGTIFEELLTVNSDDAILLNNLAKVYHQRGDEALSRATLWKSLQADPNLENSVGWYAAIARENGGDEGVVAALHTMAEIPGSWRSQLGLARYDLAAKRWEHAEHIYSMILNRQGRPMPADLLMQMSGDLGNAGQMETIIQWVEPHYEPSFHGLAVGNNLIKAHFELGQFDKARELVNQLFSQQRPDWQKALHFWDTELAKVNVQAREVSTGTPVVSMLSYKSPLWARDGIPSAAILPEKSAQATRVVIFGSTALKNSSEDKPTLQLADNVGRLSRSLPLFLSEYIQLSSELIALPIIPYIDNHGFALFGKEYDNEDLCKLASKCDPLPDIIIGISIDTQSSPWILQYRILQTADQKLLAENKIPANPENPSEGVWELLQNTVKALQPSSSKWESPKWYDVPSESALLDYLLRLEQLLALLCANRDDLGTSQLNGEREIMQGTLQLSLSNPENFLLRTLLQQVSVQMKKHRPEIWQEYSERLERLDNEFPCIEF